MIQKSPPVYMWNVRQDSHEWEDLRKGIPTASQFSRIVTPAKLLLSKQSDKYACELIDELLPSPTVKRLPSDEEHRGTVLEPEARDQYSLIIGDVRQCGFVFGDSTKTWGASPDGLVGDDGGLEIKCMMGKNHLATTLDPKVPNEHRSQIFANLLSTGRQWWDWYAYHPDLKPILVRVERDDKYREWEEKFVPALEKFLARLEELKERFGIKNG